MIHEKKLENLFDKQEEKGYKKVWVLHQYLNKNIKTELSEVDRDFLKNLFNVSENYLNDAIKKAESENSDEAKAQRKQYFMEQTFSRGINSKEFDRHTKFNE